jgi:hypothetical protein
VRSLCERRITGWVLRVEGWVGHLSIRKFVAESADFVPAGKCGFPWKGTFHGLDVAGTVGPVEACGLP